MIDSKELLCLNISVLRRARVSKVFLWCSQCKHQLGLWVYRFFIAISFHSADLCCIAKFSLSRSWPKFLRDFVSKSGCLVVKSELIAPASWVASCPKQSLHEKALIGMINDTLRLEFQGPGEKKLNIASNSSRKSMSKINCVLKHGTEEGAQSDRKWESFVVESVAFHERRKFTHIASGGGSWRGSGLIMYSPWVWRFRDDSVKSSGDSTFARRAHLFILSCAQVTATPDGNICMQSNNAEQWFVGAAFIEIRRATSMFTRQQMRGSRVNANRN